MKQTALTKPRNCYVVMHDTELDGLYSNVKKLWLSLQIYNKTKIGFIMEGKKVVQIPLKTYYSIYRVLKRRNDLFINVQRFENEAKVLSVYKSVIK